MKPADAGLTCNRVARLLEPRVTGQTIRNWHKLGLKACGHDGDVPLFRLEAVKAFRDKYKGRRNGGKRRGAGRKRKVGGEAHGTDPGVRDFAALSEENRAEQSREERESAEALRQILSGQVPAHEIPLFAVRARMSAADCERLAQTNKAGREVFEFQLRLGKYRPTEEVEAAQRRMLHRLRQALSRAPGRIGAAGAASLPRDAAHLAPIVRAACDKAAADELQRVIEEALGEDGDSETGGGAGQEDREAA